MKLDVSDAMFQISGLGGHELTCGPVSSPLVSMTGTTGPFLAVHARDQFRPVRVEIARHSAAPSPPDGYDSLSEVSVHAPGGLLVEDFEGERQRVLTKVTGDLRIRITVRRTPPNLRDEERPSESFLIEAWPAPASPPIDDHPRLDVEPEPTVDPVRATRPGDVVAGEELTAAAKAAGRRFVVLLDTPVTDQAGHCSASVLIPRRRLKTFNWTSPLCGWAGNGSSGSYDQAIEGEVAYTYLAPDWDPLTTARALWACERTVLDVVRGRSVTHEWQWLTPAHVPRDQQAPVLPRPTVLTLTYSDEPSDSDQPWTRIELTHDDLPTAWAPLMETYWMVRLSSLPRWSSRW